MEDRFIVQDLEFHEKEDTGALTARLEGDFRNVQSGISEKLPLNAMYLSCGVTGFIGECFRCYLHHV